MDDFGYTKESNFENIADAIRSKNGTDNTYAPNEMASAIEELKVGELDFSSIYDEKQADEINQHYKDGIAYVEQIKAENPNPSGNWSNKFYRNRKLIFMPPLNFAGITNFRQCWRDARNLQFFADNKFYNNMAADFSYAWHGCGSLINMPNEMECVNALSFSYAWCSSPALKKMPKIFIAPKVTNYDNAWYSCTNLTNMPDELNTENVTSLVGTWYNCGSLKKIILTSVANCSIFTNAFTSYDRLSLEVVHFSEWKAGDISIKHPNLEAESIDYNIENAIDKEEGATDRTLTLHATAGANWDVNSKYQGEERNLILTQKGIEVTW